MAEKVNQQPCVTIVHPSPCPTLHLWFFRTVSHHLNRLTASAQVQFMWLRHVSGRLLTPVSAEWSLQPALNAAGLLFALFSRSAAPLPSGHPDRHHIFLLALNSSHLPNMDLVFENMTAKDSGENSYFQLLMCI